MWSIERRHRGIALSVAIVIAPVVAACTREAGLDNRTAGWQAATIQNVAVQRAGRFDPRTLAAIKADFRAAAPETVRFAVSSARLDQTAATAIGLQAAWLRDRPSLAVVVVGHTDVTGDDVSNVRLGLRRARSVRAALVARGIAADRIRVLSAGSRVPAEPGAFGAAANRRAVTTVDGVATTAGVPLPGEIAERIYDVYKSGTQTVTEAESTETN